MQPWNMQWKVDSPRWAKNRGKRKIKANAKLPEARESAVLTTTLSVPLCLCGFAFLAVSLHAGEGRKAAIHGNYNARDKC